METSLNGLAHDFKSTAKHFEADLEKPIRQASEKAADVVNSGTQYVKSNSYKGIAIAAATGLVMGSLVTAILRRRSE